MIKTVEIQKRASRAALAGLLAVSLCGGTMLGGGCVPGVRGPSHREQDVGGRHAFL